MQDWIEEFGQGWIDRDPEAVMSLFDKMEIEFYESATDNPIKDWSEVKKLWNVVPVNQEDVTFESNILCEKENYAIIN